MAIRKLKGILPALATAVIMGLAGLSSFASATSSISNTGPDSTNKIIFKNSSVCEVLNNNNLSLTNNTTQNATSGDVDVNHNTNAGFPSDWGNWDPAVWAAHGFTYDQWHAQFMAHMSAEAGNLRAHWGSLSSGGGASSGDASNNSTVNNTVRINNGSACGGKSSTPGGGTIDNTGPDSHNTIVLGNSTTKTHGNLTVVDGSSDTDQNAASGNASANHNTNVGGSGSGNAANNSSNNGSVGVNNPNPPAGGGGNGSGSQTASIENTGPDSTNKIIFKDSSETTVTNTNVINVATTNYQTATSGDVDVNHNTTAGGAASGDTANNASSSTSVTVSN